MDPLSLLVNFMNLIQFHLTYSIDEPSRIMLKRYITERELDAFGIFVGKESEGKVEAITKSNNNV